METIVSWLALLLALGAVAYAWKLQQELQVANRRLDRYNRSLFDANDEIRTMREETVAALAGVRAEIRLPKGAQAVFDPEMTVREAMAIHPQTEQILAAFHLGGCDSCAVAPDDTLASICRENGRDLSQVLQNLNLLVDTAHTSHNGHTQIVKVPNVEVTF